MSSAALTPRAEERWLAGASPVERLSATTALFVLVSVVIHVAMVATTLVGTRPPPPPLQEIAVEVVQDVPKETPASKPEPAKTDAAKADPPKAEPAKLEPPKADPPKAGPVKPDAPTTKLEPAKPVAPAPIDAAEARKVETIRAMEKEIASLKAQQAALQAETAADAQAADAAAEPAAARPAALRDTGLGQLPESFQVVALPAAVGAAGETVGYRDIVFSALEKAKEIGGEMGLPGSAGVHFEIDASGRLIKVELVHPSGVDALDAQALALVRKAAPFPPPPQGAQRSFDANVNFVTASGR